MVVNVGDAMEFWTGGRFKSTLHRVAEGKGEERWSLVYFDQPDDEVELVV
jgi:isopenicillin N synthase-like dioxygenase